MSISGPQVQLGVSGLCPLMDILFILLPPLFPFYSFLTPVATSIQSISCSLLERSCSHGCKKDGNGIVSTSFFESEIPSLQKAIRDEFMMYYYNVYVWRVERVNLLKEGLAWLGRVEGYTEIAS